MKEISPQELYQLVTSQADINIVDVRTKELYDEGHVPGAIHIPLSQIPDSLDQFDKDQHYYIICQKSIKSKEACQILSQHGYNVTNVSEGSPAYPGPMESSSK
ncbi:rhodanese [Aerococcus urinaehominis]|uniref:Rhodanese n=1 Tax=Aerococcus urinaehominis TaxID=128944 RepID=A0A0X8FLF3_9LACT|nr:rhodanese-like domain-containing protein [Aerococcus urinaehominis]AMB99482.1 rhodanese [Aerococcus urinaehominis]SDM26913.1 Rhodanese-related sulfurtransferase [Aerococcus urinaehominis]